MFYRFHSPFNQKLYFVSLVFGSKYKLLLVLQRAVLSKEVIQQTWLSQTEFQKMLQEILAQQIDRPCHLESLCSSFYSLNVVGNNKHKTSARHISIIPIAICINMNKQFFIASTGLYNLNGLLYDSNFVTQQKDNRIQSELFN